MLHFCIAFSLNIFCSCCFVGCAILVHSLLDVKCWCCELLDVGAKAVGNWSRGAGRYEGSTRKRLPELEAGAPQKSDVDKKRHVGVSEVAKKILRFFFGSDTLSTC